MSFYDHFTKNEKMPTKFGMKLVNRKNEYILKILVDLMNNKNFHILEIGPGRGTFAKLCKKEKVRYTAIELNPKMAKNLKIEGFNVLEAKVPPIKLEPDIFDIVYMDQVLEHMNNQSEAFELAEECCRVLKKDGIICIISPDYLMWKEDFFNLDYSHNYVTTVRRLKDIFYDLNLKTVYTNYISGYIVGDITTFLLSYFGRLLIKARYICLLSLGLINEARVYKIRSTLLRSFIIIGRKL